MKSLKAYLLAAALSGTVFFACDSTSNTQNSSSGSGSESQTTPNDSSGTKSRKNIGLGEDNQKDSLGFPPNQSNLNSDSTSEKHAN